MDGKKEVKGMKRIVSIVLACMFSVNCFAVDASAVSADGADSETLVIDVSDRASGSFRVNVSANSILGAQKVLSVSKGETVQITATYSPSGSVDFGLVDSDSVFHYINVTNGRIDKSIEIAESGTYVFAIRNNSSQEIKVSGQINY